MFFNKEKINQTKEPLKETVREVTEEEALLERRAAIERLDFWGAHTIKEAKEIDKRLKLLKEEAEYREWFDKNKGDLRELFGHMKRVFMSGSQMFEMLYSGDNRITYAGMIFERDFLIKLLKRYNYDCKDYIWNGAKARLQIRYEKTF